MFNDIGVLMAVLAAAGVAAIWVAIVTPRQVSLTTGQRQTLPSFLDRFKSQFEAADFNISFYDFVRTSALLSLIAFIALTILGYIILGIALAIVIPIVYYQFLIDRRDSNEREFRKSFSNIITNFSNMLATRGSIEGAINTLAVEGDEETKKLFQYVLKRQSSPAMAAIQAEGQAGHRMMRDVLIEISKERNDIYWKQFFRVLAEASVHGGDIRPILDSLARSQREFATILAQVEAQQAATRFASALYLPTPIIFVVVFSLLGDPEIYRKFYQTTAGVIAQAFVAISGVLGWVLARQLGRRGLYVQKVVSIQKEKSSLV
jgi:Flp pilus assembly protein TadB